MNHLLSFLFFPILVQCQKLSSEKNIELQKHCGKSVPSIERHRSIHTNKASRSDSPWIASIHVTHYWYPNITLEERQDIFWCTGSLISHRHILTAAHCVLNLKSKCTDDGQLISSEIVPHNIARLSVAFMETCENGECQDVRPFETKKFEVKQAFVSNKYTDFECVGNKAHSGGDVAIIELAEDVSYSHLVYPICLNDKTPKDGDKMTLYGYGQNGTGISSHTLRSQETTVTSKCVKPKNFDTVCATHPLSQPCGGDSGGPYVTFDRRGAAYVAATVSGGEEYCDTVIENQGKGPTKLPPNFNSDVSKHLTWICAATGICVNREIEDTVKIYEKIGLTEKWYTLVKPLSGVDIYVL